MARLVNGIFFGIFLAFALAVTITRSDAEEYPNHPIRIIAPIAAGGPSDTAARLVGVALERQLGQPIFIENRTGAGGVTGTEIAAQAPADGYTLLVSIAATFNIIPLIEKVGYDCERDFVPLGQIWSAPQALAVNATSKVRTVAELVAYAKSSPGKLTFGSAGVGTTTHLSIGLLSQEAGINIIHVPYRGTSQSLADVVGGHIDAIFGDVANLAPFVKSGALRALAVTDSKRSTLLPNVPTMSEAGFPEVMMVNWYGLHALTRTPPRVLDRLKVAVQATQMDPDYQAALAQNASTTGTIGSEAFADMIRENGRRIAPLVKSLGITLK